MWSFGITGQLLISCCGCFLHEFVTVLKVVFWPFLCTECYSVYKKFLCLTAMSVGSRKVVFQRESLHCQGSGITQYPASPQYMPAQGEGSQLSQWASGWSLIIALLGFDSHWVTLISLMLVLKMRETYKNVETCTLLGCYAASIGNFLPTFLSQNVSNCLGIHIM